MHLNTSGAQVKGSSNNFRLGDWHPDQIKISLREPLIELIYEDGFVIKTIYTLFK